MRGDTRFGSINAGAALLLSLALAGCGSTSDIFKTSALDVFHSSSKATTETPGQPEVDTDVDCPGVQVRTGAATLMIGSKPGEGEPSAMDLRYQGSIVRTARECHVSAGVMTMKVGIEGRVVTGPSGGPGDIIVPMRLAVVQEGVNPKTIVSKFAQIPVSIAGAVDRISFTHVDPDISFPLPQPLGLIDNYVVYVGFDPSGLKPEKKKPAVKPRPKARPSASKKPAAKPAG